MEETVTGGTYTTNEFPTKEINDGFKERVEKYLRLSHQTLAEMLALRDEEEGKTKSVEDCPLQPNQPYTPYTPYNPYRPVNTKWCPISMTECNNPFGDCINCPYHGGVTYNTTCTNATVDLNNIASNLTKEGADTQNSTGFFDRIKKEK